MNVQFRPNVLLNKGAQVATAVRQLDGAADLRLQVMQGRRSGQGCDYLSQLVPELRQFLSSQRGAVARMEHTCTSGSELGLARQPVRVGTAHPIGPFVRADPQHESASVPRHCRLERHVHDGSRRKAMALHPGATARSVDPAWASGPVQIRRPPFQVRSTCRGTGAEGVRGEATSADQGDSVLVPGASARV
jgi:hypothetical protein